MNLHQLLEALPNWLVFTFVVVNMLALGMQLSVRQIVAPLRNVPLTMKALLANFVLVPLTAYALVNGLHLEHGFALGLILLACSAGDPFVTKLSESAKGDMAYSLGVMAMLSVVTVLYMPIFVPLLLPGVKVDPVEIAKPLIILIILPLIAGLILRAKVRPLTERCAPVLDKLASILIYAAVLLFAIVHWRDIATVIGEHDILAAIILVAAALVYGYLLGGPDQLHRGDLALNTAWRGVSAGIAVGINNFPSEQNVFTMAIIIVLVSAAILMPVSATTLRKKNEAQKRLQAPSISRADD